MAGRIPHGFIDDLLARSDIVSVIGESITLKKKGSNYMACCPFHNESTPSFSVSPEKQIFYCFGCGIGGNAVKFLMEYQHLDFVEAIESLAQRVNLEVPREGTSSPRSADYKKLLDILDETAGFYVHKLRENTKADAYLKQRGIDKDTTALFRIGYAPAGFDNLKNLHKSADSESLFLKAGLLSQKNNKAYSRFRDRLMFPIRDRRGRVIAFGGRVLSDSNQAKYLNSPETTVFQKRRTLYGVHELKQAKKLKHIIVVEGYMDVVSLAAHGINNCVATLGTAITQDHIKQLFKLCPHLVFCFDGDTAGRRAAVAALEQTLPVFRDSYEVNFAFLPDNEDPDSLVSNKGKTAFEALIAQARPLSEFLFEHLQEELDLSTPEGRATFAERAKPLLADIVASTFRDLILTELSNKAGLEIKHITEKTQKITRPKPLLTRAEGSKRHYSTLRITALLLVRNPTLANDKALPSITDIQQLEQQSNTEVLTDIINKIQTLGITNTASLLAAYQDNPYESIIKRLAEWSPPQGQDEKTEFLQVMEKLKSKLIEQKQEKLIEKVEKGTINEEEKALLRKLQRASAQKVSPKKVT